MIKTDKEILKTIKTKQKEIDSIPWPHPDWADLNDWAFENENELFEATRYMACRYDLFLPFWHKAGRPTKGFESALWTKEDALGTES